jgi:hypothetical protein
MSDDDDLFGSSGSGGDDTDDLIATAASKKPITKPKAKPKRLQKKSAPAKKRKRDIPGRFRLTFVKYRLLPISPLTNSFSLQMRITTRTTMTTKRGSLMIPTTMTTSPHPKSSQREIAWKP